MFTGGCGAIGSVMLNYFIERYPDTRFINLDALTYAGKAEHIVDRPNYRLYHGNICDADLVNVILETERPTVMIHLAAETHVDNSFGNSFAFTQTNVFGTHTLLECARKYGKFQKIIHMSTDEVYGSVEDGKSCNEKTSMIAPSNPYSASKAAAEMLCHAYTLSFKLPIIILRCNNAISPFQHEEKLIPKVINNIRNGQKIPIHGRGAAKRTFIHALDIASAFDVVIEKGEPSCIYNIGSEEELTVMEVVGYILKQMKPEEKIEEWVTYTDDRAFQDYRYSVDTTVLRNLGWVPEISFQKAIELLLEDSGNI
jgi:UDP-glucose 4,6-dehydratase